jgi:hypothetical protein
MEAAVGDELAASAPSALFFDILLRKSMQASGRA